MWRTIGDHGVGAYAGFLGSDTSEDIAAFWPAETLERLRQVKRTWDPTTPSAGTSTSSPRLSLRTGWPGDRVDRRDPVTEEGPGSTEQGGG